MRCPEGPAKRLRTSRTAGRSNTSNSDGPPYASGSRLACGRPASPPPMSAGISTHTVANGSRGRTTVAAAHAPSTTSPTPAIHRLSAPHPLGWLAEPAAQRAAAPGPEHLGSAPPIRRTDSPLTRGGPLRQTSRPSAGRPAPHIVAIMAILFPAVDVRRCPLPTAKRCRTWTSNLLSVLWATTPARPSHRGYHGHSVSRC